MKEEKMNMEQELKKMVFKTIEDHLSLREFETWLYSQENLLDLMREELIFELVSFNYNQKGAKYEFKNTFLKYFQRDDFMYWKVKTNLQDLIDEKETRDRILNDFYEIGHNELPFLLRLGYYMYELEEAEYMSSGRDGVIENIKRDSAALLQEILEEERKNPDSKISSFNQLNPLEGNAGAMHTRYAKMWWEFWK